MVALRVDAGLHRLFAADRARVLRVFLLGQRFLPMSQQVVGTGADSRDCSEQERRIEDALAEKMRVRQSCANFPNLPPGGCVPPGASPLLPGAIPLPPRAPILFLRARAAAILRATILHVQDPPGAIPLPPGTNSLPPGGVPPGSRPIDWKSRGMHGFQDAMNDVKKDCPRGSCSPQKYMAMV